MTPESLEKGIRCPVCDKNHAVLNDVRETFSYFDGREEVELVAMVPTYSCSDCGNTVVGKEGQQARDAALYHHLRRLPPWQIRAIRESYGMSRKRFAEDFGIGRASVERWEKGTLIQNESMDNLLRLLRDPSDGRRLLLERLNEEKKAVDEGNENVINLDRFRFLRDLDDTTRRRASSFKPGIVRG